MKIAAVIFNIVLFGFICLVLVTDGPTKAAIYIVFTLWSLLTLVLSSVVISYSGASNKWLDFHFKRKVTERQNNSDDLSSASTFMRIMAIICNIIFFELVCWAISQTEKHAWLC